MPSAPLAAEEHPHAPSRHASDSDFWAETTTALEELERRYHVPPLAAGDVDVADRPEGFKPIA
jgi:hypothetical protein